MTLKELKALFEERNQLERKKIEICNNDDLSKNQMKQEIAKFSPRIEEIESVLRKYNSTFIVNAGILARKICDVLSHNISESEVSFQHACIGKWYEKEYFEGYEKYYQGERCLRIYINSLGQTEKIRLFNQPVSKDYTFDTDYILGNYYLNCFTLLSDNKIKYSQLFHQACWLAVEECKKAKNFELQTEANKKQKLINKKIKILQKESRLLEKINNKITKTPTVILTRDEIEECETSEKV